MKAEAYSSVHSILGCTVFEQGMYCALCAVHVMSEYSYRYKSAYFLKVSAVVKITERGQHDFKKDLRSINNFPIYSNGLPC